jgi:hypothetical protein
MMKNFIYKTSVIMMIAACLMTVSCKDQDHTFREFVVEGGIRYLGAVSSAKALIGFERIEVQFSVADPETSKVGIYWNDYADSLMVNVEAGQFVKQIIPFSEATYALFIKSFDSKGNSSNPIELSARSVGNNFINTLSHRMISSKTTTGGNDLYIEWSNAESSLGARFTDLIYTTVNGTEKRIRIDNSTGSTTLTDYKARTAFRRTTYYSIDNEWLDSITPGWHIENTIVIDKSIGSVIDYSSQNGDNAASRFYDNNYQNTWETSENYPGFATIDLGTEVPVVGINITPATQYTNGRADPRAPTLVRFESSLDNEHWVDFGEFPYDNSIYSGSRNFSIPLTNARYIRFTGIECATSPIYGGGIGGPGNTKMLLSELSVSFQLN